MTSAQPRVVELPLPPRALWSGFYAYTLDDIFPDVMAVVQHDPALIAVAGMERRGAELETQDSLWRLEVENESCVVWHHKRWLRLSTDLSLDLIRAGNVLPRHLELVFVPQRPESRHTATLEYWTFGPDEWELVGWSYFSRRKTHRFFQRLHARGVDADFRAPYISFQLRLLPKSVDLTQMQLLAYCGTAYPIPGRRR